MWNGLPAEASVEVQSAPAALAQAIKRPLNEDARHLRLAANAAADARARFDLRRQAEAYLDWYTHILGLRARPHEASTPIASAAPAHDLDHICGEG